MQDAVKEKEVKIWKKGRKEGAEEEENENEDENEMSIKMWWESEVLPFLLHVLLRCGVMLMMTRTMMKVTIIIKLKVGGIDG